ncbi:MAG: AmmeMemoRadiSam system protein B [Candidatus Omnitrophica bacterium]|nr:AmmeMemoRadiSam system protein B [Candidatus Omnitrophota bacterium]MCF7877094.1 AmmeMemoRadiSam system protein B [Candidatus Omnitrophota bacterium]MCF7878286.1 AmmeMemoRadiSam system protein B [Candidatus Omnitrophota bacterium]MCF7893282.1 AmmeMemoRadiSam system protein B [Candidatus Omnitrophota bacterium]
MKKEDIFLVIFLFLFNFNLFAESVKKADLAGLWYPGQPKQLASLIRECLNRADTSLLKGEVVGMISPHAGIQYSGKIAAAGFKALAGKKIDKVIVVGCSHRQNYNKIAVFDKNAYQTPLGALSAGKRLSDKLTAYHPKIEYSLEPFYKENSIEMIIPFIQVALGNPRIVLTVIGSQSWSNAKILGDALAGTLAGEENFLIVASTDLSHYLPVNQAEKIDKETALLIKEFKPEKLYRKCVNQNRMCGTTAVAAVMIASKKLGADKSEILAYSHSAQVTGKGGKTVGYLSAAFIKNKNNKKEESVKMEGILNHVQKKELINIARKTLNQYIKKGETYQPEVDDLELKKDMGAFVTLRKNGNLRGCIGNIIAKSPLYIGVRDMAIAASTQDPRFPPVEESELDDINLEISVLSPLEKIDNPDKIVLGKHGVLVKKGLRSGVFLPQVADETGWSKEEFMNNLCAHKAGLEPTCWKTGDCDIFIFSAEVFEE